MMLLRRVLGGRVKIDHEPMAAMARFRQVGRREPEAGGILLGRFIRESSDVVVDEVTTPTAADVRRRFLFRRSARPHQRVINARWASTRGTCLYLGEWHTHPEPDPTASCIDVRDWKRRLRQDEFEGDALLFVIVGTEKIRAWEGSREHRTVAALKEESE